MNIAKPKGKKIVKRQAKSLLAKSSKKTSKKSLKKVEAALLRLNPQLSQIGDLEKGTTIQIPEGFGRTADESVKPSRGLAEELLRHSESSLTRLRDALKEHAARSAERCEQVQVWLKSARAKELVRKAPELKKVFASARAAAKALPKEQAEAIAAQEKALDKVQAQLANFRPGPG